MRRVQGERAFAFRDRIVQAPLDAEYVGPNDVSAREIWIEGERSRDKFVGAPEVALGVGAAAQGDGEPELDG